MCHCTYILKKVSTELTSQLQIYVKGENMPRPTWTPKANLYTLPVQGLVEGLSFVKGIRQAGSCTGKRSGEVACPCAIGG